MKGCRSVLISLLWIQLLFSGSDAFGGHPLTVWKIQQANKQIENKDLEEAEKQLIEALKGDPLNPILHFNLGVVYYLQKNFKRAVRSLKDADELASSQDQGGQLSFMARFNQAMVWSEMKKLNEALKSYQMALELDPTSIEVKTNIELLFQNQQNSQDKSESEDESGESEDNQENQSSDSSESDEEQDSDQSEERDDEKQNQPEDQPEPKDFENEQLTREQVKKILEELKAQEQRVRAKEFDKNTTEVPDGKDW